MKQPRTNTVHARITDAVLAKLTKRAERERRPIAALLAIILEEAADQEPPDEPPASVLPPPPPAKVTKPGRKAKL